MSSGTIPAILDRLEGVREMRDGWQARCPSHDDNRASLSISNGDDGRTLVHCHAGCAATAIVSAVGMKMADLMPPTSSLNGSNGKARFNIVKTYDYRDEQGELLYQVCRMEPKDFRQRRPDGKGGFTYKLGAVRRVIYMLPQLLAADPSKLVLIPEGEKDADELAARGLIATCNAGGAMKWRKEYADSLEGRNVVILPDNDQPGHDHAELVANSLSGKAASIKVLALSGLPERGDVSDWLAAGGTVDKLAALVEQAPEWTPTKKSRPKRELATGASATADRDGRDKLDLRSSNARTDTANSARFALKFGADVRHCDAWSRWYVWTGKRWQHDDERHVDRMAKELAADIWKQATKLLPDVDHVTGRELTSFARATANAKGINSTLALARSESGIAITSDKFNGHPWLLNCANGTVDLKTGQLLPHDRNHLITSLCPLEYHADARCPTWVEAVDLILGRQAQLVGFTKRLLGSALVGQVIEHILPIFHGDGSNGKGLILETLLDVLGGDYAAKVASDLLLASYGDQHPTRIADLFGKRLVVASETDDGRRLAEGLVKELTGGDRLKGRRMREDFWEFVPSHTLLLITNHKPRVYGTDHGIWRRLCLVPFTQKFWDAERGESGPPELKADKGLRNKLRAENAGILAWLVGGCLEWQRDGLGQPDEVTAATATYRASEDVLGAFFDEHCYFGENCMVKASTMRACYESWCKSNGEKPVSGRRFGDALTANGVERKKSDGVWYMGVALINWGE